MSRELGPGALAQRLGSLPLVIDGLRVELAEVPVPGYYEGVPRPRGLALLTGGGVRGCGECVAWTRAEQEIFLTACERLPLPHRVTVGAFSAFLAEALDDPYHRAAVEGAALDLALRQAGTNPFALAGRGAAPVAFCRSIGRETDALERVESMIERDPETRIKVDVPEAGWTDDEWARLAGTERIVVVDFKRDSAPDQVARAHAFLPHAWLEDPPPDSITLDARAPWLRRVALDGYVLAAVDLEAPEIPPAAVNVKAPRVGGWLEALRCLETCRQRGLEAYVGGMFEVDVGRLQARVLASLFTAEAWNDLAPLGPSDPTSPLLLSSDYVGFAPGVETTSSATS